MSYFNKVVPRILGGIGNQLFCYAAARRLAIVSGAELVIDAKSGFVRDHDYQRNYELDHFRIPCRKATASELLSPFPRVRRYLKRAANRRRSFDERTYVQQVGFEFEPRLLHFKPRRTVYLEGYWQSEDYFRDVEATIREDLRIIPPTDRSNVDMAASIRDGVSVAVHVRFFDAPGEGGKNNAPADYYARAVAMMETLVPTGHYFVFSDQPDAARALIPLADNRVTSVSHNRGDANAYADLWLMTQSMHFIIANSTFQLVGRMVGGAHAQDVRDRTRVCNAGRQDVVGFRSFVTGTLDQGMRMIYVGTLDTTPDRDSGWIDAFRDLGVSVLSYSSSPRTEFSGLLGRFFGRFHIGPANGLMQDNLIKLVEREKPDWIHFRLPVEFDRSTILEIKKRGVVCTHYFNDDPFSRLAPVGFHWKFRHAVAAYDGHFVYRLHNVESYLKAGAVHVEHCPPSYDPRRHFPVFPLPDEGGILADAAFVGHWENDWRVDCLDALVRNGFDVILKGGTWDRAIRGRAIGKLAPITHAFGEEYNRVYASVAAGLCFFSKINRDTWTRRALEIVAVGGLLVCERTDEAQSYFKDREEACFFSSIKELIEIVADLKAHPAKREKVRAAGYKKLLANRNTIDDRASQVVRYVRSIRNPS